MTHESDLRACHFGTRIVSERRVVAFTIGPGFVPTQTAASSIPRLAALLGKPVDELRDTPVAHTLSAEAAGAGFAAAVALAERYRGQEISKGPGLKLDERLRAR